MVISNRQTSEDPITLFGEHDWAALEGREYCSWDGPNMKTCQRHHYEDGLIYQAKAAGAEIWPSIGGWSLSDPFPAMAASEVAREKFANKCVQLIEEYGFDGIDIGMLLFDLLLFIYCVQTWSSSSDDTHNHFTSSIRLGISWLCVSFLSSVCSCVVSSIGQ